VLRLILAFVDIMLHRRGPEDLPSSKFLVGLLLGASIGIGVALTYWMGGTLREIAVGTLVVAFNVWFVWALLRTFNRQRRFPQTVAAILGTDVLLTLLRAPVIPFIEVPEDPQRATLTLPALIVTAVVVWSIDINAFVFSRALERPYLLCVAIVIGYALLMFSLQATLLQQAT
jgi:xanthine/uracil permease